MSNAFESLMKNETVRAELEALEGVTSAIVSAEERSVIVRLKKDTDDIKNAVLAVLRGHRLTISPHLILNATDAQLSLPAEDLSGMLEMIEVPQSAAKISDTGEIPDLQAIMMNVLLEPDGEPVAS